MLYLKASQSNTIAVTWTERANSATVYRLRLTNLATLEATDIYLNAIDNLSSYESRYDKFAFTLGALEKGQYRYEVTENPAIYAAGDMVQVAATHLVYESLVAGNIGNAVTDTTKWLGSTDATRVS